MFIESGILLKHNLSCAFELEHYITILFQQFTKPQISFLPYLKQEKKNR